MNDKNVLIKKIEKLTSDYNVANDELKELIEMDYPIPVKKERFFFVSSRIKRAFSSLMDAENELKQLK